MFINLKEGQKDIRYEDVIKKEIVVPESSDSSSKIKKDMEYEDPY